MKRFFVIIFFVCFAALGYGQNLPESRNRNAGYLAEEGNAAALDFYSRLRKGKNNMVFSPFALAQSMGIPFTGAEGSTQAQMARVLRFRLAKPALADAFKWLREDLLGKSPYRGAISLWLQNGGIESSFMTAVDQAYGNVVRKVDFITRPEATRVEMNRWIVDVGGGKLPPLDPARRLSSATRMVVLSCALMKGRWEHTFDTRKTVQAPFFQNPYLTRTVPMMFETGEYQYASVEDAYLLELPYEPAKGTAAKISLIFLLPREVYGLDDLENSLSVSKLNRWMEVLQKRTVAIGIPRFAVSNALSYAEELKAAGLDDPFNDSANFRGIRQIGDLKISDVLQQVSFSVDEGGSEAGLSHSSSIEWSDAVLVATPFSVNRPFMFMVVERTTGVILFIGRIVSP